MGKGSFVGCALANCATDSQVLRTERPLLLTRRQFLSCLGGGMLTSASGLSYARWIEPRWLEISRITIPRISPSDFATPVRLLHLSDFHLSSVVPLEFIAESVNLGLAEKPDVIVLTGDFFTGRPATIDSYAAVLARFAAAAPTFACLGNHDGGRWAERSGGMGTIDRVLTLLGAARITCLLNESCRIAVRGRPLQLIGVGDLWAGMCNPGKAFGVTPPRNGAGRVVLNHNPDAKDLLHPFDWDVMLSGHTHGGQVRLPFLGAPFAPVRDKRFIEGLYRWENRWMHITAGVGNLHGIRFNCRPKVSVVTLA